MKIAVACGGSGGHLVPGLVTARELERREHCVTLWLTGRDAERGSISDWTGGIETVRASGVPRGFSVGTIRGIFRSGGALLSCRRRMKKDTPSALLGMGSYASVGPVLAARSLGVPVVLHEANAAVGRAVSFLARFGAEIAVSFKGMAIEGREVRTVWTGLPLRPVSHGRLTDPALDAHRFTVLVMGGSQGAHALNETCSAALCALYRAGVDVQVVHLSGPSEEQKVRTTYESAGLPHVVFGFLHEMGLAYNVADLAVSRAGASSCAELGAYGVPALLIPLPGAPRDHQRLNAEAHATGGGADWWPQSELTEDRLRHYLGGMVVDVDRRTRMKAALDGMPAGSAAARLADLVERTAGVP